MIRNVRTTVIRPSLLLVSLAVAGLGLSACGDADDSATTPTETASSGPTSTTPSTATSLTFTISGSEVAPEGPLTYTLTCDPVGGTLPSPEAACAKLGSTKNVFAEVPASRVCADVVGGDGDMAIQGIWNGEPIDTTADQHDSCATKRFNRIVKALGIVSTPTTPITPGTP